MRRRRTERCASFFLQRVERRDHLVVSFEFDAAGHHQLDPLAERKGEEIRWIHPPDVAVGEGDHSLVEIHADGPRRRTGPGGISLSVLSCFEECTGKSDELSPLVRYERRMGNCLCGAESN